jgi:hypothetical protein
MIFPWFQDLTLFFCQGQQATEVKVMVTPEEATYHGWGTYQHPFGWLVLRFRSIFLDGR